MGRIIPYTMEKMFETTSHQPVGYCLAQKPPERTLNPFFILNIHPKHGLLANLHIWRFPKMGPPSAILIHLKMDIP